MSANDGSDALWRIVHHHQHCRKMRADFKARGKDGSLRALAHSGQVVMTEARLNVIYDFIDDLCGHVQRGDLMKAVRMAREWEEIKTEDREVFGENYGDGQ